MMGGDVWVIKNSFHILTLKKYPSAGISKKEKEFVKSLAIL